MVINLTQITNDNVLDDTRKKNITFTLPSNFIEKYKGKHPQWGPLGYFTYKRTYARLIPEENRSEEFWETVKRVVEGIFTTQKRHCLKNGYRWSERKALKSSKEMFRRIWKFKFLPPGRGLWSVGTEFLEKKGGAAANNCGFVSTKNIAEEGSKVFRWCMDMLMVGVGIGFDTKGKETITIKKPKRIDDIFIIPDSREGWWIALGMVIDPFLFSEEKLIKMQEIRREEESIYEHVPIYDGIPTFDFSEIREKGEPIKGFGGKASGPRPLIDLIDYVYKILDGRVSQPIRSIDILDIFNNIGKCVIAGNVRRCLEKSMEVHTKRGLLPIDQVLVTDKVLVHDGSYKHVKKIFKQGKQETIRINTSMGNIVCTPNHRMAIFNGLKSYTWKEAGKLDPKTDRLLSTPHFEGKNTITPEFAWLIGYYHGDGHSNINNVKYGGTVSFAMSKKNYTKGLKEKFDIALHQFGHEAHPHHKGNSTHINVYKKEFAEKMIVYKKPHEMSIIPREIWEGNSEIRSAYLAGICDSDGGVRNTLVWTKYPEFARQIQKIALSLGIATTFHKRKGKKIVKGKKYDGGCSVTLRGLRSQKIASELIEPYSAIWKVEQKSNKKNGLSFPYHILIDAKANNEIDFQPLSSGLIRPTKKEYEEIDMGNGQTQLLELKYRDANYDTLLEKGLVHDHWIPIEIESIESNGIHETYDIEVEGDHEFVCENLLVHNSAEIALGDPNDYEYMDAKNPSNLENLEEHRDARWASNNTVVVKIGDDYSEIAKRIAMNGEPGLFWLENAREYSRMCDPPNNLDHRIEGCNPCSEQSLESYELCVRGDTRIQTKNGCFPIKSLEGKVVEVWNGEKWSKTTVQQTSPKEKLVRVHFSDGSYLDCTEYHEFDALGKTKRKAVKKKAIELEKGDKMPEWSIGEFEGVHENFAYEYGLMAGDGYLDGKKPMLVLHGTKMELRSSISGKWYKTQHPEGYNSPFARVSMKDILDVKLSEKLRNHNIGLPDDMFQWDQHSILDFVAGWIDTDGSLSLQQNTDHYRIFGSEQKIRDLQLLLRRIGIDHSSVYLEAEESESTNYGDRNYSIWTCLIPSYECEGIPTRLKKASRFGSRYKINNAHPEGQKVDAARKQKVVKVEHLNIEEAVYCFNEPQRHMGVFGNTLTYQCCLVETFPSRHDSYDDYRKTLKMAYMYAKSITLERTNWAETNGVMDRNRRIGTSISGIMNAHAKFGKSVILEWIKKGYDYITYLDNLYSDDWLIVNKSIKRTTIKPSGTTSLLPGENPGIHYPHSEYYIRRIRIESDSPLISELENKGYEVYIDPQSAVYKKDENGETIESDGVKVIDYFNTKIVNFPVHEKNFVHGKKDVSMWKQLAHVIDYQKYWSDNQVSVTITFKKSEIPELEDLIEFAEDKVKSLSFLPINDHGYENAPYEEITKKEYEEMVRKLKPLDFTGIVIDGVGEKYCNNADGHCEIKY